jgi:hypothetical protein
VHSRTEFFECNRREPPRSCVDRGLWIVNRHKTFVNSFLQTPPLAPRCG